MSKSVICDHCEETISVHGLTHSDYEVNWCKDCIEQDYQLLLEANLPHNAIPIMGATHFSWYSSAPIIKKIPKKSSKTPDKPKEPEVIIEVKPENLNICHRQYYGTHCECSKCFDFEVKSYSKPKVKNVFGY